MGTAIDLFFLTPRMYLYALGAPLSSGPLTIVPFMGMVCLLLGLVMAIVKREPAVLWTLVGIAGSQSFALASVPLSKSVLDSTPVFPTFFAMEIALTIWMTVRARRSRIAAALFGLFNLNWALVAAFVALEAFTG